MVDKGLSRFIPGEVHEAHRPVAASAWEVAALAVRGGNLVERNRLAGTWVFHKLSRWFGGPVPRWSVTVRRRRRQRGGPDARRSPSRAPSRTSWADRCSMPP